MTRPPLPRWLLLPVTAAVVFLCVPLVALLARVPWSRLPALLSAPAAVDALWLSLRTCALTTLVAAHLSERNNLPMLARSALATALNCAPKDVLARPKSERLAQFLSGNLK